MYLKLEILLILMYNCIMMEQRISSEEAIYYPPPPKLLFTLLTLYEVNLGFFKKEMRVAFFLLFLAKLNILNVIFYLKILKV